MADQEEIPEFINYSEKAEDKNVSLSGYWTTLLVKYHKIAHPPWSIKDRSLWKRMEKEFGVDVLTEMVEEWMDKALEPHRFESFYANRHKYHSKIVGKDYGWD